MTAAVLFDIDGTILVTGGAGAAAWQRAFREQQGIDADVAEHTDAGMTDPEITEVIFKEVIGREATTAERARVVAGYLYHLHDTVRESDGYRVMPGIEETLTELIDGGILLGLVTGNVEAAAHIKLSRAGLNRFFSFGGYGSDSRSRTELTKRALERAEMVSGGHGRDLRTAISVGDTPRDVDAGHGAGIKVVGVATGAYSVAQLREAGADWAVEDLRRAYPTPSAAPLRGRRRPRSSRASARRPWPAARCWCGRRRHRDQPPDVGLAVVAGQLLQGAGIVGAAA